jgi:hypothetical protein
MIASTSPGHPPAHERTHKRSQKHARSSSEDAAMAPAFKHDNGMGSSIDGDDYFGTDSSVRALSIGNPAAAMSAEDETNVIRDGNNAILRQFEMKMIKREYSKTQTSRGNVAPSSSRTMTLDWSGFSGAAHVCSPGERSPSAERKKAPRERRAGKKSPRELATPTTEDEEIIEVHHRHGHRHGHRHRSTLDGHGSSSRLAISQRRLSADGSARALSADSALPPGQTSPQYRNRRTGKRNLLIQTSSEIRAATRPSSARSSRRKSVEAGGSTGNGINISHGQTPEIRSSTRPSSSRSSRRMSAELGGSIGNGDASNGGIGSGSGTGHRPLRSRRTTSGERSERQQQPRPARPEGTQASPQPRGQHSSPNSKRTPRASNRNSRSTSPSNTGRRKSTSPHASNRGLAAASATTLDTRRKSTSHSRSRRGLSFDNGSGDFMGSGLKKQSSIKW